MCRPAPARGTAVTSRSKLLPAALAALLLSACGSDNPTATAVGPGPDPGGTPTTGRTFVIQPGPNATEDMKEAMIQAAPKDVIQFGCGFFELSSTLQLINTESITIRGCGKDKTILSFKNSSGVEGILAVNVGNLLIEDLTVLDTGGNGIELRSVNHGTLKRVRAIWSSGGGRHSTTPITADNYDDNDYRLLHVPCTDPPTLNPKAPENGAGDTTSPDYTVSDKSGRYGIYPVSSDGILIEESESVGASDAGIYVGQTNNAIIRKSRAAYNVFGFEIENVRGGEYDSNLAECNTGGFLIYDLNDLRQYGDRSRMHHNVSRNNNTYNFTENGFVSDVPPGSGMITLSYDRIDIYDNEFRDNNTAGIIHTSYEIFPPGDRPSDRRIDWYSEGVHIFRNKFFNNGNGLPLATTRDLYGRDVTQMTPEDLLKDADGDGFADGPPEPNPKYARLLPVLVGLKVQAACLDPRNAAICAAAGAGGFAAAVETQDPTYLRAQTGFRGAHIIWDGLIDELDEDCPYPVDAQNKPVAKDGRDKPILSNDHPNPSCHYNAYKFKLTEPSKPRKTPDWFMSCIDADNEFSTDSIAFANFNGTQGLNGVLIKDPTNPDDWPAILEMTVAEAPEFPASFDLAPHDCPTAYGRNLDLLPPVEIPRFVPSGNFDAMPSQETVARLCGAAVAEGDANFGAAPVNCPTLDQYHLFENPEDPTSAPNGDGIPFSLNTKLFSDYAVKYRVAYLPPGATATWKDSSAGITANFTFPTGTIIAKTFSFRNGAVETPIETRLLIRRVNAAGRARWDGLPYIWQTVNGKRVARLKMTGGTAAVDWDFADVDSGAHHVGNTDKYLIPNVNQCQSCHSDTRKEPGASPIGLKVRNLNGPYRPESAAQTGQGDHEVSGVNQLQYWCQTGRLIDCPADLGVDDQTQIATKVERVPIYNKPGDSGLADPKRDTEARARAWLEVNCHHCHTEKAFAASTGLYLDVLRPVNTSYGICKTPTATGQDGSDGRPVDIFPGDAARSILEFRIGPTATKPASLMPPLGRSVVDAAGHALIAEWINDVVDGTYEDAGCESAQ